MNTRRSLSALLLLAVINCLSASAQQPASLSQAPGAVPPLVNFASTLTDINSNPIVGVTGVTFLLYKDQEGGSPLWMETQTVTTDEKGRYSVTLGSASTSGLPTNLFVAGESRWLAVQPHGEIEQPRVLLLSVPYALKAGDAATVGGLPASAFMLANSGAAASKSSSATPATATSAAGKPATPAANPAVTGKGTLNYIPMWDSASDIINSVIFQKASGIGISTTAPAASLDVNGKTDIRDTLTLFPNSTDNPLAVSGTVFKVASTGLVTFVAGQTFPGTGKGTITGVTTAAGSGLSGGGTTGTLSLKVPAAGITNAMLADSKITLNDSTTGGLTTPGAMTLGSTYTIGLKACAASQILEYSGTAWNCVAPTGTGTITGVTAGTDLTGGGTGGKVTLNLDTTKVPQLSAANVFTANQTVKGSLNVGTGTSTAISVLEASASAPEALGPTLTLTNPLGSGNFGGASIDFNTYAPSTSGTYNPSSRIEAFGDGGGGDSLWFESNNDKSFAGPNQGLALNMNIGSNGRGE